MAKMGHSKNKKQEVDKKQNVESTQGELYVAMRRFLATKAVESLEPKKCHSKNKKEKVAKKERRELCQHKDRYIGFGMKKRPRCCCYLKELKRLSDAERRRKKVSLMAAEVRVKSGFPMNFPKSI